MIRLPKDSAGNVIPVLTPVSSGVLESLDDVPESTPIFSQLDSIYKQDTILQVIALSDCYCAVSPQEVSTTSHFLLERQPTFIRIPVGECLTVLNGTVYWSKLE